MPLPDPFAQRLEASRGVERDPDFMRAVRLENDIRDLERDAERLRALGECWDGKVDELDAEAMALRTRRNRKAAA